MNYMKQDFYDQLTLRNGFFISRDLQLKIKECSLVLAGCGLSSNFAVLATRLGFEKFILIDGDNVDESNLNRQPFSLNHVGLNKAEAISEIIKQINPAIRSKIIAQYIDSSMVRGIVSEGDIILNTVDFTEVTYEINEEVASQSKISLFPLNIGFGALLLVFSKNSKSLIEMTGGKIARSDKEFLLSLYKNLEGYKLPNYVKYHLVGVFNYIRKNGFFPQNGIAANINSSLMAMVIVKYLNREKIRFAPKPIFLDVREDKWL